MPDAVDAAIFRQQSPGPDSDANLSVGHARSEQLPPCHHTVLIARNPREFLIYRPRVSFHTDS